MIDWNKAEKTFSLQGCAKSGSNCKICQDAGKLIGIKQEQHIFWSLVNFSLSCYIFNEEINEDQQLKGKDIWTDLCPS